MKVDGRVVADLYLTAHRFENVGGHQHVSVDDWQFDVHDLLFVVIRQRRHAINVAESEHWFR